MNQSLMLCVEGSLMRLNDCAKGGFELQEVRDRVVTFLPLDRPSPVSVASTIPSTGQQHVLLDMAQRDRTCSLPVRGLGFTQPFCTGDASPCAPLPFLKMLPSSVSLVENNHF